MKTILITGGAGFVGSNLARSCKEYYENCRVVALDNLKRRGSELTLPRLRLAGVEFVHGDMRCRSDLEAVGSFDTVIDCAAEPSVLAGQDGSADYVVDTNLSGTVNLLEVVRRNGARIVFLSTSRVYPIEPLQRLALEETEDRFELSNVQDIPGASIAGVSERFPLEGVRTLYGATKYCSEMLLAEFCDMYGIPAIVNRCGVLTGPWQMGKVDQGVVVLWMAYHLFEQPLSFIGYGGTGKQARDILHIDDLATLLHLQLGDFDKFSGQTFNVGGGREVSISLRELTRISQELTGKVVPITQVPEARKGDIPVYLSDCTKIKQFAGWSPQRSVHRVLQDILSWLQENKGSLRSVMF
jgi:CDP-paratose 2-epimerase